MNDIHSEKDIAKEKDFNRFLDVFRNLMERGRGSDSEERSFQAIDVMYSILALTSNEKPLRSIFKKLAQERGVHQKFFEKWAENRIWRVECTLCQDGVRGGTAAALHFPEICYCRCDAGQKKKNKDEEDALKREVYSCDWCGIDSPAAGSIGGNWKTITEPSTTNKSIHLCGTCVTARQAALEMVETKCSEARREREAQK